MKAFYRHLTSRRRTFSRQLGMIWNLYIKVRAPYFGPVDEMWLAPDMQGMPNHFNLEHKFKLLPFGGESA